MARRFGRTPPGLAAPRSSAVWPGRLRGTGAAMRWDAGFGCGRMSPAAPALASPGCEAAQPFVWPLPARAHAPCQRRAKACPARSPGWRRVAPLRARLALRGGASRPSLRALCTRIPPAGCGRVCRCGSPPGRKPPTAGRKRRTAMTRAVYAMDGKGVSHWKKHLIIFWGSMPVARWLYCAAQASAMCA